MQNYDECIAQQLMDILEKVIKDFEAKHHLDLMAKFEPDWWCYDSDMSYQDMSELLKEFFKNHYPSLFDHEINKKCFDMFDQTAEECKDKNIMEFHDKIIETTKKFLDINVAPIVDKHWSRIEKAMSKVKKYFSGLGIKLSVSYYNDELNVIYFTKNGKLLDDYSIIDPLFDTYYTVEALCSDIKYDIRYDDNVDHYHCEDGCYDEILELVPEDQREDVDICNITRVEHDSDCYYNSVTNVFKYFDEDNLIEF